MSGTPDIVSDLVSTSTFGVWDVKKGRFNVPFSGAQVRSWGKSIGNVLTAEQFRDEINTALDSPIARGIATGAAAVAGSLALAGVGSALMAGPAVGTAAEAGTAGTVAGTEGAIAPAVVEGATPAAGTAIAEPASGLVNFGGNVAETAVPNSFASGTAYTGEVTAGMGGSPGVVANAVPGVASGLPGTAVGIPGAVEMAPMVGLNNAGVPATMMADMTAGLNAAPTAASWWAGLSPSVQAAIVGGGIFAGGQMITGGLGGLFAGVSAEKKLELEKLINEQRQNQVQYLNKNNQYAPSLQFKNRPGPAGMLNTVNSLNTVNNV